MTITVRERPPLDLHAILTSADGRASFRWAADAPDPRDQPQSISFQTARGDGFKSGGCTLARRIDVDYSDLRLLDTLELVGLDGSTAYEGRVRDQPRSTGQMHQVQVDTVGYMSHAKDRRFAMIFVDQDIGQWAGMPLNAKAVTAVAGVSFGDFSWVAEQGALVCALPNQALGAQTRNDTWLIAPSNVKIAQVQYAGAVTSLPAGWVTQLIVSSDDVGTTAEVYSLTLNSALQKPTVTTARRYTVLRVSSNGSAATPAAGASVRMAKIATYGNHGLTLRAPVTSGDPDGVYASDVIRWLVDNYCPMLNTDGVQDTTYPIGQLAFRDRTFPYDAFLEANRVHLWGLEVWERRTLHYGGVDLTDYTWQVRTDQPGVDMNLQGDTTDDLISGLEVEYTNVRTQTLELLLPADHAELRDDDIENPFNRAGYPGEDTLRLSFPTTPDIALEMGRLALAERNQPKAPGTITISGHVLDRAGNWQPAWKVRAGDTIAITNHPNDRPRLVQETSYSHDGRQVQIAVDSTFKAVDAVMDRFGGALAAHNLA